MTRINKPNVRRIAFKKQCYEQLEQYLEERDMHLNHKELLLDLAALVDFLEEGNYVGAHYLGNVLQERLKIKVPEWQKLMERHIDSRFVVPIIENKQFNREEQN